MGFTMEIIVKALLVFLFLGVKLNSEDYLQYVDQIINDFAEQMKSELNLRITADGGSMPDAVKTIEVDFSTNRRATIDESRKIEVFAVNRFLDIINSHEKIKPFLSKYPFTPKEVQVSVAFLNPHNEDNSDGTIAYMSSLNGEICYWTNDPLLNKFSSIVKEPFEEAKKIVENKPHSIAELCIHSPTPYEAYLDKLFIDFAKEAKKKWGIMCLAEGGKLANGIEEIRMRFICIKRKSLEQARALEIAVTERLSEIINKDEFLRPYLKEYPFTIPRTRVLISFNNVKGDHWTDGSVAVVHQMDNKVFYTTMPPAKNNLYPSGPSPLAEESYEEAKATLCKKK